MQFNIATSVLVVLTLVFLCHTSFVRCIKLPPIPCPDEFKYRKHSGAVYGFITVKDISYGTTVLDVELSQRGTDHVNNVGQLLLHNEDGVLKDVKEGNPITYKILFPDRDAIPKVTSIKVNGVEICTAHSRPYKPPSTDIKLKHTLNTGMPRLSYSLPNSLSSYEQPKPIVTDPVETDPKYEQPKPTVTDPVEISPRDSQPTAIVNPSDSPMSDFINSVCGQENSRVIRKLNVLGEPIKRSRFPWIAAVLEKHKNVNNFRCGGSLISTRTIISAAHCFYAGLRPLKPDEIVISMGLHNLTEWKDSLMFDVKDIIMHPDFHPTLSTVDGDVALVVTKKTVVFTTTVKPICLWEGNDDVRAIHFMTGSIVGWGGDGKRSTTTIPTLVNATIIPRKTCMRSEFRFIKLTSNRTLCAGNINRSGPCMGDSGNGLMIRNQNKWLLRGTVSAAFGTADRPCNLEQYTVYSDIAKYMDWIRSNMLL